MKIISILDDLRIKSKNVLVEFHIEEYLSIADSILKNNPFQRKRVKSSSTVYSLLRDDLKAGCVIPSIVLALTNKGFSFSDMQKPERIDQELLEFIKQNIEHVIILDGLQRTYNIIDAKEELLEEKDFDRLNIYYNTKVRCEFYLGIDKIGILYRMLTLNTGQTPMSLRHQIEILYSDYLNHTIKGIHLVREIDEKIAKRNGEYSFKEIIDGFTSYLMRDYLPFDKNDILNNIKSLEKLSRENQNVDIFESFLKAYHEFQNKIQLLGGDWVFNKEENGGDLSGSAYGTDINSIFDKPQSMTAFGAAIGFLKDQDLITGFDNIIESISKMKFGTSVPYALLNLLQKLDDIRKNAPKIGNAQRAYFFYFFREVFNKEGDSYLSIDAAIENAFMRYRQNA
jgi:hypothetical protein